jgi:hypothetical protein
MGPHRRAETNGFTTVLIAYNDDAGPEVGIARAWLGARDAIVLEHACPRETARGDLDPLAAAKLGLCSDIYAVNVGGYLGDGLRAVVRAATMARKPVHFHHAATLAGLGRRSESGTPREPLRTGTCVDLSHPFVVRQGAVLLYGAHDERAAHSLIGGHIWPGLRHVPEVWFAESLAGTVVEALADENTGLQGVGQLLGWAMRLNGSVLERTLTALGALGSANTQEELAAIVGCRRESVSTALRDLGRRGLVERRGGSVRLTATGVVELARRSAPQPDGPSSTRAVFEQ